MFGKVRSSVEYTIVDIISAFMLLVHPSSSFYLIFIVFLFKWIFYLAAYLSVFITSVWVKFIETSNYY